MGGRSSPHRSSRSSRSSREGPSSSSTPGSENTGAPSGTGTRPGRPTAAGSGAWEPGRSTAYGPGLMGLPGTCRGGAGGRCSHWMPTSVQSWWDRCHGEPASSELAPGVRGGRERTGWKPGPPARPYRAWVGPRARGAGFGVSGEDQDPSGSRVGEGTGLAFGQAPLAGQGLAGASTAGALASGTATTGASAAGAADGGGWGARRNHPAGGATPGQDWAPAAGSAAAGSATAGSATAGSATAGSATAGSAASRPCDGRLGGGRGWRGIGFGRARTRNHQARRHRPGRHKVFRIITAKQAGTLPFLLPRDAIMTIPTRLVTFCTHHRPQSRHISGKYRSVPILTLSGSYGITRGSMLPIESERVQRAIFGACQTNAAPCP